MSLAKRIRKKKVLVLCPSPRGTAAAQRLKYEQYFEHLEDEGYSFTISNFQTHRFWNIIYKKGRILEKIFWVFFGYLKRFGDLLRAPFYDGVFVTIWATPLGMPLYENLLFLFNKNVIYDLDDMIFLKNVDHARSPFLEKIKGKKKPIVLMRKARYVIVCTPKLEEIALGLNKYKNVIDISSTFNTDRFVPVNGYNKNDVTIIGWTGTHSTIPFLESLQNVLLEVSQKRKIKLLVISDKEYYMPGVETEFVSWSEQTEISDLHKIEIGLYPIPKNEWSLGKSSLKALTYMSIAVPAVATAYGTNFRIMEDGVQGYLAKDDEEWVSRLIQLIDDVSLRKKMGLAGRKRVVEMFSVKINLPKYLQVFNEVISKK
jgi:glycosyltransferase involved in cell wall biosynthesis